MRERSKDVPWICTARRSWRDAWICRDGACRWIGFDARDRCPWCGAESAHVLYSDLQVLKDGVDRIAQRREYQAQLERLEREWKADPQCDREFD